MTNSRDEIIAQLALPFAADLMECSLVMTPNDFNALLITINGTVARRLPSDYFKTMMKEPKPCGNKGCDCHISASKINTLIRYLRDLQDTREQATAQE